MVQSSLSTSISATISAKTGLAPISDFSWSGVPLSPSNSGYFYRTPNPFRRRKNDNLQYRWEFLTPLCFITLTPPEKYQLKPKHGKTRNGKVGKNGKIDAKDLHFLWFSLAKICPKTRKAKHEMFHFKSTSKSELTYRETASETAFAASISDAILEPNSKTTFTIYKGLLFWESRLIFMQFLLNFSQKQHILCYFQHKCSIPLYLACFGLLLFTFPEVKLHVLAIFRLILAYFWSRKVAQRNKITGGWASSCRNWPGPRKCDRSASGGTHSSAKFQSKTD